MYHFFAMMSRMKYIDRWALMRNSIPENISEHSLEVSMLSHALAVIGNRRFSRKLNSEKAALIGLYHDSTEILTGDMPTPIKYYNPDIKKAFKEIEQTSAEKLLHMLPEDLRPDFECLFFPSEEDEYLFRLVKAADKLSALIKCIEEAKTGNREFVRAEVALRVSLEDMKLDEVTSFMQDFLPSYSLTLDELN